MGAQPWPVPIPFVFLIASISKPITVAVKKLTKIIGSSTKKHPVSTRAHSCERVVSFITTRRPRGRDPSATVRGRMSYYRRRFFFRARRPYLGTSSLQIEFNCIKHNSLLTKQSGLTRSLSLKASDYFCTPSIRIAPRDRHERFSEALFALFRLASRGPICRPALPR